MRFLPLLVGLPVVLWGFCGTVARAQGLRMTGGVGSMMDVDPRLDIPRGTPLYQLGIAWVHVAKGDSSGYAQDFGRPKFVYGLQWSDYSNVRCQDPDYMPELPESRLGHSIVVYAGFERPMWRSSDGSWSLSYALMNGLSVNTRTWDRETNMENELIGSRIALFFGLGLYVGFRRGNWEITAGPRFEHISNAALARPNKGANSMNLAVMGTYYFERGKADGQGTDEGMVTERVEFEGKGFYVDFTYRVGLKTSIGEWLVDKKAQRAGEELVYGDYGLYASQSFSIVPMYRYARRFASGIGIDILHEPYLGRIECQNDERPHDVDKLSWGLSLNHQVFYKRWNMNFAIGWYFSRPFKRYANTDEEYGYYERVGLDYRLPILGDHIRVGYDVLAHRTKAYAAELALHVELGR